MKKEDFKDMPINPFAAGPLLKEYDLLQRVSAFSEAPDGVEDEKGKTIYLDPRDIDKMLRFCVLMADPRGNPLATEQDFTFRAAAAWSLLGVKNGHVVVRLQQKRHWWYQRMLVEYLKLCFNDKYALWFAAKTSYYETLKFLTEPVDLLVTDYQTIKMRNSAMMDLDKTRTQIAALEASLFKYQEVMEDAVVESFFPDRLAEKFAIDY